MDPSVTVREARLSDAKAVFALIREHADRLVVRSLSNVVSNLDRFLVAETATGELVGTIAYDLLPEIGDPAGTTAELQSFCVKSSMRGKGVGRELIDRQSARIARLGVRHVIVLTFEVEMFEHFGFRKIDKRSIMHKLYRGCINCSKHESPFTCPEQAMERIPS